MIRHLMKMGSALRPRGVFGASVSGSVIGGAYSAFSSDSISTSGYIRDIAGGAIAGGALGLGVGAVGKYIGRSGKGAVQSAKAISDESLQLFDKKWIRQALWQDKKKTLSGLWGMKRELGSEMKKTLMDFGSEKFSADYWK